MSAEAKIRESFDIRAKQEVAIFPAKKLTLSKNSGKYKIGVRTK
jgi:hypothetical protein